MVRTPPRPSNLLYTTRATSALSTRMPVIWLLSDRTMRSGIAGTSAAFAASAAVTAIAATSTGRRIVLLCPPTVRSPQFFNVPNSSVASFAIWSSAVAFRTDVTNARSFSRFSRPP